MQYKLIRTFLLAFGLLVSFLAQAEYLLGPGDLVRITVYGSPDLSTETRVTQGGKLTFPLLGEVAVGGSSVVQSEKKISSMLEEGGFVKNAQVNIVVLQFTSQQISILGDVLKPGRYPLERTSTLVEVLALAGGISLNGSDIVTILSQSEGKTIKYDYDLPDLLRKGKGANIKIYTDDIVYVPHAPMFYIYGEIQRAGQFRLERNMTVAQALAVGGGLTIRGTERGLRIKRRSADGVLETIEARPDDLLIKDDVLFVRESLF
ncbi:MAG: polysaccharide export protein EpsE [Gammaproteobacteria bacterium]|nr:polysaccharide export protein EpsE [Gammaproteobacteria bacterium]